MIGSRHAAIAATLALAGAAFAVAAEPLQGQALQDWYSGVSVEGTTADGKTFRAYHAADGKITAVVDGQYRNEGTWRYAEPDRICVEWRDPSWGRTPCFRVVAAGDVWHVDHVSDASKSVRVKRVEGNAFGF